MYISHHTHTDTHSLTLTHRTLSRGVRNHMTSHDGTDSRQQVPIPDCLFILTLCTVSTRQNQRAAMTERFLGLARCRKRARQAWSMLPLHSTVTSLKVWFYIHAQLEVILALTRIQTQSSPLSVRPPPLLRRLTQGATVAASAPLIPAPPIHLYTLASVCTWSEFVGIQHVDRERGLGGGLSVQRRRGMKGKKVWQG